MSAANWVEVPNSLAVGAVDRGVIYTQSPPSGGGNHVFGFHTVADDVPGAIAFRSDVTDFNPMTLGGMISSAMKRGRSAISGGFAPFIFQGLDLDDIDGTAYMLGLEDAEPSRVLLRRGILSDGLVAKGKLLTALTEPFTLADLQTLEVSVDGGTPQTITFDAAEFTAIGAALATEVAAEINTDLVGGTASASDLVPGAVLLESDGDASTIEVTGGTAAAALGFPSGLSGILAASTGTFIRDTWVHLRLDVVDNGGAAELDVFRNDLDVNRLGLPPDWQAIPGMSQAVDPVADALIGGFAGFGYRTEDVQRKYVLFDHVEVFRNL